MYVVRNGVLVLIASVIALLVIVLVAYPLYLVGTAMLTTDWTWMKAGAIALGPLICLAPIVIGRRYA